VPLSIHWFPGMEEDVHSCLRTRAGYSSVCHIMSFCRDACRSMSVGPGQHRKSFFAITGRVEAASKGLRLG